MKMETKTKRNLLIWSIVLLIILNLTSLATIWYHRVQFKNTSKRRMNSKMARLQKQKMARHGSKRPRVLSREMNLTVSQSQEFDSLWQLHSNQRRTYEDQMAKNRYKMSEILSQTDIDTTEFYMLSKKQGLIMQKLDHSMMAMITEMRSTLDETQMKGFLKKIKIGMLLH